MSLSPLGFFDERFFEAPSHSNHQMPFVAMDVVTFEKHLAVIKCANCLVSYPYADQVTDPIRLVTNVCLIQPRGRSGLLGNRSLPWKPSRTNHRCLPWRTQRGPLYPYIIFESSLSQEIIPALPNMDD